MHGEEDHWRYSEAQTEQALHDGVHNANPERGALDWISLGTHEDTSPADLLRIRRGCSTLVSSMGHLRDLRLMSALPMGGHQHAIGPSSPILAHQDWTVKSKSGTMNGMPATNKGARTKARITRAAADLVWERGVAGTRLDDVQAATGTSKSQLYHYFADKAALLREVVWVETERVLDAQRPTLDRLDSWEALERWSDQVVAGKAREGCRGSCPIGSLVTQLAEIDPAARADLATAFERWEGYLVAGLAAMRKRGDLLPEANPENLAVATLASVQGGLLLAQAARSTQPLRLALDAALRHLRSWAAPPSC